MYSSQQRLQHLGEAALMVFEEICAMMRYDLDNDSTNSYEG